MPHINRIRVNNVKYNFGTQFYDDFVMRFSGKNTIYDLANGGGKSVLMMLLLQNMLPNCTLDEKQPVEKLFRLGNDNQTIHSLVEWKLNNCDIKNGFRYMTTGFCARKGRDGEGDPEKNRDVASVEYFNYCILYREFNDNDILNLPLASGRERITYNGLRSYLRELEKKDYSLQIHIFDRKGDYQRFINDYGIYESEWEIIRGINKTEGHVRTYFETMYRTTRKVVEDLLIEEIIQKSFQNRTNQDEDGNDMARTLLDIKDKLIELSKKKSQLQDYDRQIQTIREFLEKLQEIEGTYQRKEDLHKRMASAYHTCLEGVKTLTDEQEQLAKEQEILLKRIREYNRKIDTAGVQYEEIALKNAENKAEISKKLLADLEKQYQKERENQDIRESIQDYLTYIENQKNYETANAAVEAAGGNHQNILQELRSMAAQMKGYMEEEEQSLKEEVHRAGQELDEIEAALEQLRQESQKKDKSTAVWENEQARLQTESAFRDERIKKLKNNTNLLILDHLSQEMHKKKAHQKQIEEKIAALEKSEKKAGEAYQQAEAEAMWKSRQESQMREQLEEMREFMRDYRFQEEKVRKLEKIYGAKDHDQLKKNISEIYRNSLEQLGELQREMEYRQQKIEALAADLPFLKSEQIKKLVTYIHRHHKGKVQYGMDYLQGLEQGEKEELLDLYPYFPYALLLTGCFDEVVSDHRLSEQLLEDQAVPLISMEAVKAKERLLSESSLAFAVKSREFFRDPLKCKEEKQRQEAELEKQKESRRRLKERLQVLEEDIAFLDLFLNSYESGYQEKQEKYQEQKKYIRDFDTDYQALQSEIEEQKNAGEDARQGKERAWKRLEETRREIACLEEIQKLQMENGRAAKEIKHLEEEIHSAGEAVLSIAGKMEELAAKGKELRARIPVMQQKQQVQKAEWDTVYSRYYMQGVAPTIWHSRESLEVLFKGKKEAFEQKNADLTDKQKLAESYLAAGKRSLAAIEYRGVTLDKLEKMHAENRMQPVSQEELMAQKENLQQLLQKVESEKKTLERYQERKNQLLGGIAHARRMIEDRYGTYEDLQCPKEKLQEFIEENKKALSLAQEEEKQVRKKEKQAEKEQVSLISMQEDMQYMMKEEKIDWEKEKVLLEDGLSLKETYRSLKAEFEKSRKEEYQRRELFEKARIRMGEALERYGAYELAAEVKKNLEIPEGAEDISAYMDSLNETISCIELEKSRIAKGITDMEQMKENFESQCLQSCLNIKTELDRLSQLSRITMDDKVISIIQLKIPYISEELYKDAMAGYITRVVERADTFQSVQERLKYIKNQLAWKRLFGVIVTDMDAIRLNLYKRERIRQQSRYLRYEEAVGSTGQSQGIYIQFLIAIIHYISSINARGSKPAELKKVLFIDNPFGAAKDIYIWEPIFKLLKSNHVQLVVPARGTPPAITGRFEVNYILGQKLIGDRQQTVVVDYRSQTDQDEMEYQPIAFEQETFDFDA